MNLLRSAPYLVLGDLLAITLVSMVGFLTHKESPFSPRLFATLLPVIVAWGLQAPWLGVYQARVYHSAAQSWRAALAMLLAAPMAALLRSLMLRQALVVPVFAIALAFSAALGMLAWRLIYAALGAKASKHG